MRKHKTVAIDTGRDAGKSFLIVEMPAWQAEKWAIKTMLAMGRAGVEVPDDALASGLAGLMAIGVSGLLRLPFQDAEPLLDEMFACVSFVPNPSMMHPERSDRPMSRPLMMGDALNDGDIEDALTFLKLRGEVAELHLGFSIAGALSALAERVQTSSQQNTPTSRSRAPRSSPKAKRA